MVDQWEADSDWVSYPRSASAWVVAGALHQMLVDEWG